MFYADPAQALDQDGLEAVEKELEARGLSTPEVISAVAKYLLIPPSDDATNDLYDVLEDHVDDPLGVYKRIQAVEPSLREDILSTYFGEASEAPSIFIDDEDDEEEDDDILDNLMDEMDEQGNNEIDQPSPCQFSESTRLKNIFQGINPPQFSDVVLRTKKNHKERIALLPKYEDNQNDNPVFGILAVLSTNTAYGLRSGKKKETSIHQGITFQKGNVTPTMAEQAGGIWTNLSHHVEGQAAAFMRSQDITEAWLFMNASTPCLGATGCKANLPVMLAEGSKLHVVNKWGKETIYTGAADD
jgi:hypothetical protein